ncbi:uncharacterized protein BDZ99DRAFT_538101 [Mytilinidion resinicola]|uniref:DUF6594 domain-containing protein n=1 Tax=Mytilinidion resinicola TaxID=574789 RepID=A0A6A6YEL0_9PEZI|nr:uncharacterized protein BDZ99DRAFT_538101 [Mytilinidion resinicola]KAF2807039.1 hypothetical protein BDZ99DRAFT_538101 [Mytilinidion resinicola]
MLTTATRPPCPPLQHTETPFILQIDGSTDEKLDVCFTPSHTSIDALPGPTSARRAPVDELVAGYPRLAGFMSLAPETVILRRFTALNIQNLLYLQAELKHLETELRAQEKFDAQTEKGKRQMYARDWFWLSMSEEDEDGRQWGIVKRMRGVLKEYNEALLQQQSLAKLQTPSKSALRTVQDWLARPTDGNYSLIGRDCRIWGYRFTTTDQARDLINPLANREDRFSAHLLSYLLPTSKTSTASQSLPFLRESALEAQLQRCSVICRITAIVTAVIASLLPVVSVVILYSLSSMKARLGVMAGFDTLFAFLLAGCATVRRGEVFAATAAFAAVQVVFIGTSGGGNGNGMG